MVRRVGNTKKPLNISTSSSGTDPGSSDLSLNESDIPLTNLKPREKQNVTKLPPASSTNLRSKSTTWYRPNPTFEDFQESPVRSRGPVTSTPQKKQTVPNDFQQAGPSSRVSPRPPTAMEMHPLNATIANRSTQPLLNNTPKRITPIRVNSGIGITAGESYQNIFEGQIGSAASHPDNPLGNAFHDMFYKKPILRENAELQPIFAQALKKLDNDTHELRMKYNKSTSHFERHKMRQELNEILAHHLHNPTFNIQHLDERLAWEKQIWQHSAMFTQHLNSADNELRETISRERK